LQYTFAITTLGLMMLVAWLVVFIAWRINVPSIVAYLGVGLIILPLTEQVIPFLGYAGRPTGLPVTIQLIGEAGIVLLLFIVGLELSLDRIRDVGRVAVYAGLGQVVITAIGGTGISLLLGFSVIESVFLGAALTFSSTVVVVKLLDQKRELDSLYGRIAVGIFLVQDLVVIIVLALLAGLGSAAGATAFSTIAWGIAKAFLGMASLLALSVIASRYLLARPFGWASRFPDMLLIWSLTWCFLYVSVAGALGISRELGAFLAGISLAQLGCSHDLRRRVHPLMNFFVAVFFITLGVEMNVSGALENWAAAGWLSLFVLIGNPLIFVWIIARSGYSEKTAFLTGVTVAQVSEFSFVFAAVGMGSGLIGESILSLIALVGILTIALSSYMILYNHELYSWVRRWGLLRVFGAKQEEDERPPALKAHFVVVGLNSLGRRLVKSLVARDEKVLSIDVDPVKLRSVPGAKVQGGIEYLSTTEEANLAQAKFAVSALQIEDANNLFAFRCRQLGVPAAVHAFDMSVLDELKELGVQYLINSKRAGVAAILRTLEELEERRK
jgi:Kef-type K+ transport system membrane component KefB